MTANLPRLLMVSAFVSHTQGSPPIAAELADRLEGELATIIRVSARASSLRRALEIMTTTLTRRNDYDAAIVDLFSGRAFFWGEAVCGLLHRLRRPFVLVLHGGGLPAFAEHRRRRVEATLRKANVVVAPSQYLAEQMRVYRADILVVPNAIRLASYPFRLRDRVQPHLVWLRAMHQIYNPGLAVQVAARLLKEFPDLQLTMIGADKGDGSWGKTATAAAATLGGARFSMPGGIPKSEVPQWLNRGDIFLNTTNIDNTPLSVIEAMACGLPIVSTSVGGLPYLLNDGEDALLVPPNDPEAMFAGVLRVLTESNLAERLSRHGRRKVEAFDWSAVVPVWRNLLAHL